MKNLILALVLMPTMSLAPIVRSFFRPQATMSHRPKYQLIS